MLYSAGGKILANIDGSLRACRCCQDNRWETFQCQHVGDTPSIMGTLVRQGDVSCIDAYTKHSWKIRRGPALNKGGIGVPRGRYAELVFSTVVGFGGFGLGAMAQGGIGGHTSVSRAGSLPSFCPCPKHHLDDLTFTIDMKTVGAIPSYPIGVGTYLCPVAIWFWQGGPNGLGGPGWSGSIRPALANGDGQWSRSQFGMGQVGNGYLGTGDLDNGMIMDSGSGSFKRGKCIYWAICSSALNGFGPILDEQWAAPATNEFMIDNIGFAT